MLAFLVAHEPALLIATPLALAPLVWCSPSRRGAWALAALAALICAALALDMQLRVRPGEELLYPLSGFPAPLGVALFVDPFNAFAAATTALLGLLGFAAAIGIAPGRAPAGQDQALAAVSVLALGGLFAALIAGDLFTALLGLALAAPAGTALVQAGMILDRRALPAAGLFLTHLAAILCVCFLGAAFLFAIAGSLDIRTLGASLDAPDGRAASAAGLALLAAGLGWLALSGLWTAPAHAYAAQSFGLVFYAPFVACCVFLLIRLAGLPGQTGAPDHSIAMGLTLNGLGVAGIAFGSYAALTVENVRKLILFAAAAQIGLGLLSFANADPDMAAAGILQMAAALSALLGLLAGIGLVDRGLGGIGLGALEGLGARAPLSAAAVSVLVLSLIGAPATIGFLGKWLLLSAFIEEGRWWAVAATIVALFASIVYGGRLLDRIWLRPPAEPLAGAVERGFLLPVLIASAGACLAFGLHGADLLEAAQAAARALYAFGAGP